MFGIQYFPKRSLYKNQHPVVDSCHLRNEGQTMFAIPDTRPIFSEIVEESTMADNYDLFLWPCSQPLSRIFCSRDKGAG